MTHALTYNDIHDYTISSNTVIERAVEMDTDTSPRYFGIIDYIFRSHLMLPLR